METRSVLRTQRMSIRQKTLSPEPRFQSRFPFRGLQRGLLLLLLAAPALLSPVSQAQQDTLARARSLAASGHLQEANELLSDAVRNKPQDAAFWQELGMIQLSQQLYDDAMQSFGTALRLQPDLGSAQAGEVKAAVADALQDRSTGNQDGALSCLLRARKLVPDSVELLTDFGIQADGMELYKDADAALNQAHGLAPGNAKTLYALAHVELDEQKMPAAEAHLRAYLQMRPDDATAHYGLGHLLYMMTKYDEAAQELERSIALHPQQTESYYELGEIALDQRHGEQARKEFSIVLKADPDHGGALTGMGIVAYRSKDYAQADAYLSKAVLCAPDYAPAHRFYAMTLARLGQQQQSERELALAQKLTDEQDRLRHGYILEHAP